LRDGFKELRLSLLSAGDEKGLLQLQELWSKRMTKLATLILSARCDEASIVNEIWKIELALSSQLADLEMESDCVVGELSSLREVILSMRESDEEPLGELFKELKRFVM
jgi:hypothetical protein